jgi:hypothetical protein
VDPAGPDQMGRGPSHDDIGARASACEECDVMRVQRGLGGFQLPCGCLGGVYEDYNGRIVRIIDARADDCREVTHRVGRVLYGEGLEARGLRLGIGIGRSTYGQA